MEAGPAAFLQMYLLLLVAHPSFFQYLSVIISIATAAFTIASVDFNLDTDPKLRQDLAKAVVDRVAKADVEIKKNPLRAHKHVCDVSGHCRAAACAGSEHQSNDPRHAGFVRRIDE